MCGSLSGLDRAIAESKRIKDKKKRGYTLSPDEEETLKEEWWSGLSDDAKNEYLNRYGDDPFLND